MKKLILSIVGENILKINEISGAANPKPTTGRRISLSHKRRVGFAGDGDAFFEIFCAKTLHFTADSAPKTRDGVFRAAVKQNCG
jgi:hypothetical protein